MLEDILQHMFGRSDQSLALGTICCTRDDVLSCDCAWAGRCAFEPQLAVSEQKNTKRTGHDDIIKQNILFDNPRAKSERLTKLHSTTAGAWCRRC